MGGSLHGEYAIQDRPGWYPDKIKELGSRLQVGDIIVYKNRGFFSRMIGRFETGDERTHTGVYLGNGKVGQVVDYYGLKKTGGENPKRKYGAIEVVDFPKTLSSCKGFEIFRPNVPQEAKEKIPEFVYDRVRTKFGYDAWNLLKHEMNKQLKTRLKIKPRKDDRKLSCATLATRAYERLGYDIVGVPDTRLPMPNDIKENKHVKRELDIDLTSEVPPVLD